jgi:hypothetical protein
MKKTTSALCAVLLTLTACGSGDDETAKKNIKASILEEEGAVPAGTRPTEKQADCMANGMVDDVGVEKLQEYKVLDEDLKIIKDSEPTDLEKGDAEALAAVIVGCVDMTKLIQDQVESAQTQLTGEQSECIRDAIDEDTIEAGLAASFQGKEEANNPMAKMQGEMMKCAMPSGDQMKMN